MPIFFLRGLIAEENITFHRLKLKMYHTEGLQEDQQSERRHAPARSETHNPEEMIMSISLSPFSVSSVSSLSLTRGQVDYAQNKA